MSVEWFAHPGQSVGGPLVEHADGGDGWYYRRTTYQGHVSVYRTRVADLVGVFAPSEVEPRGFWIPSPEVPS